MKKIKYFYRFAAVLLLLAFSGGTTWAGTGGYGRRNINNTNNTTIHKSTSQIDKTLQNIVGTESFYNIVNENIGSVNENIGSVSDIISSVDEVIGSYQEHPVWGWNGWTNQTSDPYPQYSWEFGQGDTGTYNCGTGPDTTNCGGNGTGYLTFLNSYLQFVGSSNLYVGSSTQFLNSYLNFLGSYVNFVGNSTQKSESESNAENNFQSLSGHHLININTKNRTVTVTLIHHYNKINNDEQINQYKKTNQYKTVNQYQTVNQVQQVTYQYNLWVFPDSPIILDLSGSGQPDVAKHIWLPHAPTFYTKYMTIFDITGDGMPTLTEWVGPQDGLLVVPNKNGKVTSGLQLFGTPGGWANGYQKLAALFDKNHTGVIKGKKLKGLYVWIDKNGNGKVDPGELYTVQQLGITEISDHFHNMKSWYIRNGKKYDTWDWWPSVMMLRKIKSVPMTH